jgi:hypothetical protein
MRIRTLLAVLAFVPACFLLPAAADSTVDRTPAVAQPEAMSPEACPTDAKGPHLTQINCCKGHKGICGCRAGKLVCCDNTTSTEPGCTCHGDEGIDN